MPRTAALRLDLYRDPPCVRSVGGKDVDAGHVASECDCVTSPPVDFRRDKHLAGTRDLLRVHLGPDHCLDVACVSHDAGLSGHGHAGRPPRMLLAESQGSSRGRHVLSPSTAVGSVVPMPGLTAPQFAGVALGGQRSQPSAWWLPQPAWRMWRSGTKRREASGNRMLGVRRPSYGAIRGSGGLRGIPGGPSADVKGRSSSRDS